MLGGETIPAGCSDRIARDVFDQAAQYAAKREALAQWDGKQLLVHTHSQSVFETRQAIARMLELPLENVRLQHVQGAGCYGHNFADDAAADAALLARAVPGKPIK